MEQRTWNFFELAIGGETESRTAGNECLSFGVVDTRIQQINAVLEGNRCGQFRQFEISLVEGYHIDPSISAVIDNLLTFRQVGKNPSQFSFLYLIMLNDFKLQFFRFILVAQSDIMRNGSDNTIDMTAIEEEFAPSLDFLPEVSEVLQDDLIDSSLCLVKFLRDEDPLLELGTHVEAALLLPLALLPRSGSIQIESRQVLLHIIIARLQQSLLKSVNIFCIIMPLKQTRRSKLKILCLVIFSPSIPTSRSLAFKRHPFQIQLRGYFLSPYQ